MSENKNGPGGLIAALRGRLVQSDFLSMGFQKCFAVISLREPQRKDPHKIQKRFLIWLGTISYEIYIIHPFILYFFEKETTEGKQVGNLEIVLWTIGLTLLLSSVLKIVQDNLVRKVKL